MEIKINLAKELGNLVSSKMENGIILWTKALLTAGLGTVLSK